MNKIYSKVWNKSLGQLVVTSELASRNTVGATPSAAAKKQPASVGLTELSGLSLRPLTMSLLLMCGLLISNVAGAQTAGQVGGSAADAAGWIVTDGITNAVIGPGGTVTFVGDDNIAVTQSGTDDQAVMNIALNKDVDLGSMGSMTIGQTKVDNTGVTVGSGVTLNSTGLAIDNGPSVTTTGVDAGGKKIINVAAGSVSAGSTDAVNGGQLNAVSLAASAGWKLSANGEATPQTIAPGGTVDFINGSNTTVTRTGSKIQVSVSPTPTFQTVTATGALTVGGAASLNGGASIGTNLIVKPGTTVNMGGNKVANVADGTIAAGSMDAVNGDQLNDVNDRLDALGANNVNQGIKYFRANSTKADAVASGTDAVAIGPETVSAGQDGFAAGHGANIDKGSDSAIAIGFSAVVGSASDNAIAMGNGTSVGTASSNAVAIGNGIAVGDASANAVAVGNGVGAGGDAVAIGHATMASGAAVGIGLNASAGGGSSVAIGNGSQGAMARDVAIGTGAGAGSSGEVTVDTDNVSVGTNAGSGVSNGGHNTSVGFQAGMGRGNDSDENVAVGDGAGLGQSGRGNVAIGNSAAGKTTAGPTTADTVTIGTSSDTTGNYAVAVGPLAVGDGLAAIAMGYNSLATGGNSLALGAGAKANYGNSVALGGGSVADSTLDAIASPAYLTNQSASYSLSVGAAPNGGSAQILRRISNVAGGFLNNDAVNVAQLKAAQQDVKDVIGQYATIGADGSLQYRRVDGDGNVYTSLDQYLDTVSSGTTTVQVPGGVKYDDGTVRDRVTLEGTSGTRISNLADGVAASDAVNLGQLDATVQANKTNYFSVNSTLAANHDNAGATGADAMAVGPQAAAVGNTSIAIGNATNAGSAATDTGAVAIGDTADARSAQSIALGVQSRAGNVDSTAIGYQSRADGTGSIALGMLASVEQQSGTPDPQDGVAIGTQAHVTREQGTAIGSGAGAFATQAQAFGTGAQARGTSAIALGTTAFADGVNAQANGTGANAHGADSLASGTGAVTYSSGGIATGVGAVAGTGNVLLAGQSVDTIAIGTGATTTGDHSIGVGSGNIVGALQSPTGGPVALTGNHSGAFGNGNTITQDNTFVVGNGVTTTQSNSVVLGNASTDRAATTETGVTIHGKAYTFAGPGAVGNGVVSVGAAGAERQVINVAAGRIGADSTDAVNGSQLFAINAAVNDPITFTGNTGTVARRLGETQSIVGGKVTAGIYTGNNLNTVVDATGKIQLQMADNPVFTSVKTGQTTMDNSGVKVGASVALNNTGLVIAAGPSVTATGINAGGMKITNVLAGTAPTDGVNVSQLNNTVAASATHYYSVNSTGGSNVNNDGATGADAIASGKSAAAAGSNSVALGQGATAGTADSVALGSASVTAAAAATTGTKIGGTSYTFAGAAPVGVVSVGSAGNERQVTNVAAGQLNGTSTDAVNGSQLFATNQQVTQNTTDINTINTDINGAGIKYFHTNSTLADSTPNGANSVAIGPVANAIGDNSVAAGNGAVANNLNDVAVGAASVTAATVAVTGTNINGAPYTFAGAKPDGAFSVGSVGHERQVQNVAAGQLNAASTDAVNGSQLFATNTAVVSINTAVNGEGIKYFHANSTLADSTPNGTNSVAIGPVANAIGDNSVAAGNGAVANNSNDVAIGAASVTAATVAVTGTKIGGTNYSFAGIAPDGAFSVGSAGHERQVQNVAAGQLSGTSTDAVNGSQLFATNQQVTQNTTDISNINNGAGIKYFHANSMAADSQALGLDSVAIGPNAVASNEGDIALGSGSITSAAVDTVSATINGVTYNFAGINPTSMVSVGSAGNERQITNVAAGQVSATSTDAVNGSQLFATNQAVNNLGTVVNNITNGNVGSKYFHANSMAADSQASGTDAVAIGPTSVASGHDSIAAGNGSKASGTASTAVGNGSTASGASSTAIGDGAQASNDNSVAIGSGSVTSRDNSVSVGSAGDERQITNVAAGTADTDAVNVSQLKQSQQEAQVGSVQYDTNADGSVNSTSVTMNPGGAPTTIHNVAAGAADTDAANVGQINDALKTAENWSKSYTDQKIDTINSNLNKIGNRANAGVAAAMAMASMPQAYQPDQSSAAVGVGTFHGESGIAVGMSTITESGRYIFKVNASTNTRGDAGVGVGAGMVW